MMSAKKITNNKDLAAMLEAIIEQGWRVEKRDAGHIVAFSPDRTQPPVTMGSTPSDHRAIKNIRAELRRKGAILP